MNDPRNRLQRVFLVVIVLAISGLFLLIVGPFLMPVFLAAIVSGLVYPLHQKLVARLRGRDQLAATTTLVLTLLVIVVPLTLFAGIVTTQALDVSRSVETYLEGEFSGPQPFQGVIDRFPILARLEPYRDQVIERGGEIATVVGGFIVDVLAAAGRGTVSFLLSLFVMLYSMFFFLRDGPAMLDRILYLIPMSSESEDKMVARFSSVTRATIKGTLIIGLVQGSLAGAALWIAGVPEVAFWTTVMVVLSVIPAVGTALVWIPAALYIAASGQVLTAALVATWCALVVGSADNFLRPMLVGRDTEMSDLMVLLSTMGGLLLFGAPGIFVGPIVAALFLTAWDIYAVEFKELLPTRDGSGAG
jgi:predicted PurR-regulated permease PerM